VIDSENTMVAVIAGPTAGGKSGLALALAQRMNGTIINADATQLYADLRVLSARPSPGEEALVPHRLYGVCDGACPVSAADWAGMARAEIEAALKAGRLPILVGGTGLYLETLIEGIAPVPEIRSAVRAAVRAMTSEDAAAALAREDGAMASRLLPSDRQRLLRALEVVRSTGRSLAEWQAVRSGGIGQSHKVRGLVIAPDRAARWAAAAARLDAMIEAGALAEVEALVARRLDPGAPVMKALGVGPLAAHLRGELTLDAALAQTLATTRQYQKRQMTWIRGRLGDWPVVAASDPAAAAAEIWGRNVNS
jgi:tRNA dimethylallyltransferase